MTDIPYIAYESAQVRQERTIRRLWILCIIMFLAFVISNGAWLYYESQFADEITVTQENENGYNNYMGGDGSITN